MRPVRSAGGGAKRRPTLRVRPRPLGPRPSRAPACAPSSALATEPPLPPDEWSRLLPGRDPASPGAPAPQGEGADPGKGADPGAAGEVAAGPGSRRPRSVGTAWGTRRGHREARPQGTSAGGWEGGWSGSCPGQRTGRRKVVRGWDALRAARARGTDPGSGARPPAAGQRGREARAFCPGFSGGAPAAVSSAQVFVFRWRGPGTAGGRGSGGGGSQSGMSLATVAGHPLPGPHSPPAGPDHPTSCPAQVLRPTGSWGRETGLGPPVLQAQLPSLLPSQAGCGWVWARGARGITQRWAALLGFFHLPAAEAGEGPAGAFGLHWGHPPPYL